MNHRYHQILVGLAACAVVAAVGTYWYESSSSRGEEPKTGTSAAHMSLVVERFEQAAKILGREGVLNNRAYTITFPRDDFDLYTESGLIPPEAGIASVFHFFPCDCGKMNVIGQFVVRDYEANDVIDALRAGQVKVVSVGPMLLEDDPRMTLVRFQGEGGHDKLANTLKETLSWTGDARMAPTTKPAGEGRMTKPRNPNE